MIHLFLTPSGDLMAFEKMPVKPTLDVKCHSHRACHCAELAFEAGAVRDIVDEYDNYCPHRYTKELESAKASAVKVKNRDEAIKYLFNSNLGEWYESSWQFFHDMKDNKIYSLEGYKMEIHDCVMCTHFVISRCDEGKCVNKLAIISPIEEQKVEVMQMNAVDAQAKQETKETIISLINSYWRFDNNQQPVSGYHDKQDLIDLILKPVPEEQKEPLVDTGSKETDFISICDELWNAGEVYAPKEFREYVKERFTITRK